MKCKLLWQKNQEVLPKDLLYQVITRWVMYTVSRLVNDDQPCIVMWRGLQRLFGEYLTIAFMDSYLRGNDEEELPSLN